MKRNFVKIGKREIDLRFDMLAMEEIEEKFGGLGDMLKALNTNGTSCKTLSELVVIFGNSALCAQDKEPDLTHRWVASHMSLAQQKEVGEAIGKAITDGMNTEIEDEDFNDGPKDKVLEELKKKDGTEKD